VSSVWVLPNHICHMSYDTGIDIDSKDRRSGPVKSPFSSSFLFLPKLAKRKEEKKKRGRRDNTAR